MKSVTKNSRSLVHGVGVNDADYKISFKGAICPFYNRWAGMLERCYSKKQHLCYSDCYVCDDWLLFSNFKKWMSSQDWKGKALDKDLLVQDNKVYSPETCVFIPASINNLLLRKKGPKRKCLTGVSYHLNSKRFTAKCSIYSKQLHIGYFKTEIEAHEAYKEVKYAHIRHVAEDLREPVKSALLRWEIK